MNQLVQIGRIKHLLDRKTLLLLINSFVFSKLFYCSSVWGNTSKRNLHKLQLVQNFAARVVLGLKKFDHISQGRRSLKWLDVTEKVLFNDLVLVFKCVNGLAPDYLGKYFIKRSAVHNKNTRGCNNFVVPRCRLSMGQRAFYFRGPKEWNGLPDNIRNTKDIITNSFRTFWTNDRTSTRYTYFSCRELCLAIDFLIDNFYVLFGSSVFRQVIGIPMGTIVKAKPEND